MGGVRADKGHPEQQEKGRIKKLGHMIDASLHRQERLLHRTHAAKSYDAKTSGQDTEAKGALQDSMTTPAAPLDGGPEADRQERQLPTKVKF